MRLINSWSSDFITAASDLVLSADFIPAQVTWSVTDKAQRLDLVIFRPSLSSRPHDTVPTPPKSHDVALGCIRYAPIALVALVTLVAPLTYRLQLLRPHCIRYALDALVAPSLHHSLHSCCSCCTLNLALTVTVMCFFATSKASIPK